MDGLNPFFLDVNRQIDAALDGLIPASDIEPTRLHEAVRWSLFAGGKRIRPALMIATGRSFGASDIELIRTAAAFEMIHTYSLIHDDLPSMDDDDLRRGKATCHIKFGEATAILAGDVLQALAFKSVADDATLSPDIRVKLISLLAVASGTPHGMVAGQQLDLSGEGIDLAINEIEKIHSLKTGALIAASASAGAIIARTSDDELAAIEQYARRLGLLFQITDDLLDVTQGTADLGKTAGKDAAVAKATYPARYGVEETLSMAVAIKNEACSALSNIAKDTSILRDLAGFVLSRTK